jgi:cell wall-associated NlpC family hydrolase
MTLNGFQISSTAFELQWLKNLISWVGVPYYAENVGDRINGVDCSELLVQSLAELGITISDTNVAGINANLTTKRPPPFGPKIKLLIIIGGESNHLGIELDENMVIHSTDAEGFENGVQITRRDKFNTISSFAVTEKWLDVTKLLDS